MMPSLSVVHTAPSATEERRPGGLLAAERDGAVEEPRHEPLEAHGHLEESPAQACRDPVDDHGGDERLADRGVGGPPRAVREEVVDRDREVVVGVHEPRIRGHDAVAVGVGVVAGQQVVLVPSGDERRHRRGRGRVHADLPVPVESHEPPRRVDVGVHDREVDAIDLRDEGPVLDGRTAEGIGADADARCPDRVEIDHGSEIADVGVAEVVLAERLAVDVGIGGASHALEPCGQERVGPIGDPAGRVGVGGAAVRRVVLEAPVGGGIVRGGHDDAVGTPRILGGSSPVVGEDRVAQRGRRHPGVAGVDAHVDPVRDEHLDRAALGGERERVRVAAEEEGPRMPAPRGSRRSPGSWRGCGFSVKLVVSDDPRWPLVPNATRCAARPGRVCGRSTRR